MDAARRPRGRTSQKNRGDMEVKPGYKQTEVGVIPAEWEVRSLEKLATTVASGRSSVGSAFGSYPVYGSTGVIGYTETPAYEGDAILAARVGANAGKLNLVSGQYGVTDNTIIVRLNNRCCLPFYWRQLESKRLNSLVFGSGQPLITGTQLKALALCAPPLPEQRAIAGALSDVDALLGALDQLIAKKRDLKQAAMQQLLTGQTRLPGFHGEWGFVKAGDVGRFRGGNGFPTKFQGETACDYPFYKVSDMNNEGNDTFMLDSNNWISDETRKQIGATAFPADSIIFAKVGAAVFLERKKILTKPSCIDNNLAALVLDKSRTDVRFIHYALLTIKFGSFVSTTALPSLSGQVLSQIAFALPPLPEQTAIAEVLTGLDAELAALEQRRAKTRALKQGMMQELLTGRVRLR